VYKIYIYAQQLITTFEHIPSWFVLFLKLPSYFP